MTQAEVAATRPADGHAIRPRPRALLSPVAAAALVLWCVLIGWMVGDLPRDCDQAAYISGAIDLVRGDQSFWHADLYNYDKQFGSYWILSLLAALVKGGQIIPASNVLQWVLLGVAGALLVLLTPFGRRPPALVLPLAFAPALVISGAFFGTSTVSFAFLMVAYAVLRHGRPWSRPVACLFVAVAAACRGDAILAVPALILYTGARRSLPGLLRWRFAWFAVAAGVLPLAVGHLIGANVGENLAGLVLRPRVIAAFLVFGLGASATLLLPLNAAAYAVAATRKRRWTVYYGLLAAAPLGPFCFYLPQLFTPRYLFTTLACLVFAVCGRRTTVVFRWLNRGAGRAIAAALLVAAVLPWCIGVRAPDLHRISVAVLRPQLFPTAKGLFPMGAYAGYVFDARGPGSALMDHNQKIFLAAMHTDFVACHGAVPILVTPMRDFLELAVHLHGGGVRSVGNGEKVPCGFAYADQRSLLRTADLYRTNPGILANALETEANVDGQAILKLGTEPTSLGRFLVDLKRRFAGRELELRPLPHGPIDLAPFSPLGGLIIASSAKPCSIAPNDIGPNENWELDRVVFSYWRLPPLPRREVVQIRCDGPFSVQSAIPVLPAYMGL